MTRIKVLFPFLLLFSLLAVLTSCNEKKHKNGNVVITGQFSNSKGDTIYLLDVNQKPPYEVIDSIVTDENGSFELYPTLFTKGFYNLTVGHGNQFATVILEPGDTLKITGDAHNLGYSWKTEGVHDAKRFEEVNKLMLSLEKKKEPFKRYQDSLLQVFQMQVSMIPKNDSSKVDSLDKVFSPLYEVSQQKLETVEDEGAVFARKFIDEDSLSFANIAVLNMLHPFYDYPYFDKVAHSLEVKYKSVPNVKALRDFVERERPLSIGKMAPDITLANPDGKPMTLSSLRGNVVLLDFWASWCAPCRAELPNVVANYKKYHAKGFEVFSVSLDLDKNAWTAAIKKDGLVWPYHVSDLQQWKSTVVPMYNIRGIPLTFLIDREGRIIDRDLRGDLLGKKLESLFTDSTATR